MLRIEDLGKVNEGEWVVEYENGYTIKIEPKEGAEDYKAFVFLGSEIEIFYPTISKAKLEMVLFSVGGL